MTARGATPTGEPAFTAKDQAALSRELADFLIEFSIALHKHAMYPPDHPSLAPATEHVTSRLVPLVADRGSLSLGVAKNQLVIEGVATDPSNAVLADLAARLHRHHIGAITFRRGAHSDEIQSLLARLSLEADRSGAMGLLPKDELSRWEYIQLFPLAYDALQMLGGGDDTRTEEGEGARAAQLWIGLARAAVATGEEGDGDKPVQTDPSMIARAIDERSGSAYDQVIVGYLLKIADELRSAHGKEALALRKRMSQLVSSLSGTTIKRLLAMGGDRVQRRKFLLSANEGMAVDAVLDLVKAASESQEEQISHSMLRMLQKLATHAEAGQGERRVRAETEVREQIAELIRDWSLKDPNPDAYTSALQAMASSGPMFAVAPDAQFRPEPRRLVQMAIEVDAFGTAVQRAVDELVADGQFRWVLDTVEEASAPALKAGVWAHLGGGETIDAIVRTEPIDTDVLDAVLERAGVQAIDPMLNALCESDSRQTRRVLLDRLVKMGSVAGAAAAARLDDKRWYVLRNMLVILSELPELPEGFTADPFSRHSDARVRRESLRIMLRDVGGRDRAICAALADGDERVVRLGLAAAQGYCPDTAVPLVARIAVSEGEEDLRVTAVSVLGTNKKQSALEALLRLTAPRKAFLGRKLPPKTKAYLAALKALTQWMPDRRAAESLAAAAASKDPEIVAAARPAREAAT